MTWTPTILHILDGQNNDKQIVAYTDGTNFSFPHSLLDETGAIVSPSVKTGSVHLTNSPTVTAGPAAYASGQNVGSLITLSGATRVSGGSGIIQSAFVTVKTALTAPFDVVFFDTVPTS